MCWFYFTAGVSAPVSVASGATSASTKFSWQQVFPQNWQVKHFSIILTLGQIDNECCPVYSLNTVQCYNNHIVTLTMLEHGPIITEILSGRFLVKKEVSVSQCICGACDQPLSILLTVHTDCYQTEATTVYINLTYVHL